jgi:hypothetical protein
MTFEFSWLDKIDDVFNRLSYIPRNAIDVKSDPTPPTLTQCGHKILMESEQGAILVFELCKYIVPVI